MLHACFISIATCFTHTLGHFITISGTNLLTRCRSASSCFLLFLVSEILHRKYSRNWTPKSRKSIFCRDAPEETRPDQRGAWGPPHHPQARPEGGRAWRGCGHPGPPLVLPFRLFIHFVEKTLGARSEIHEKFRRRRHRQP
jgi:hypothetical protein